MNKKILLLSAVAALSVVGCATNSHVAGVPGPRMTFENYAPVILNVAASRVIENYEVDNDPKDISGQFVVAPSEAIKQYAARRFPASGIGNGQFTIELQDARMYLNEIEQQNKVLSWSGIGQEDQYRLMLKIKVTPVPNQVNASASTVLKFERTLVMPSSVSLAERERRQLVFLEKLIADIDTGIIRLLDQTPSIR